VSALLLAEGPADYFGGSMMTWALPMAAFIVIAGVLFYAYRRPHHNPRLKYMAPETVTSVGTWEPGPVPVPAPAPKAAADAAPAAVVPETVTPEVAVAEAKSEGEAIDAAQEEQEGTSEGKE
jgi:hypothetical protein